jgi:hypothetical protein
MGKVHFAVKCRRIPENIKLRLQRLHAGSRRATGGKEYWIDCLTAQGVYEDGQMLRFRPSGGRLGPGQDVLPIPGNTTSQDNTNGKATK